MLNLFTLEVALLIDVKTFQYICYIPSQREMYIKNTKIKLTQFESTFINYLIQNDGYCNIQDFAKHLNLTNSKKIKRKNIVVGVSRLRRKILVQTGYDIIRCKYGFGYNIYY